ncbi:MAG: RluA family pseudouridine synthase [Lachnospiraceae bacterium]|jgi:23S rRNA pseudouridine1911/1915/1917 synthase|nr:RluA family pseudouridine synthase [Lachnospiraceae bacterium]
MERIIHVEITEEMDRMPVKELLHRLLGLSARQVSRLKFRPDGILVDGTRVSVRHILQAGQRLSLSLEPEARGSDHLKPLEGVPDIRYEDEDMLVINKPAGMVVHPSHGHYDDSLANLLVYHYGRQGQHLVVRPVGRLDKDTSGLLIIAKNAVAAASFDRQRRDGRLHRLYLALADGTPVPDSGQICAPIGRREDSLILRQVRKDGEPAVTDYQVLSSGSRCCLVRLLLHTGRTHQIRVHMAYIGHPLAGDPFYGTEHSFGMTRTALHSWQITCCQPVTGERLSFSCDMPEDMKRLAENLIALGDS